MKRSFLLPRLYHTCFGLKTEGWIGESSLSDKETLDDILLIKHRVIAVTDFELKNNIWNSSNTISTL